MPRKVEYPALVFVPKVRCPYCGGDRFEHKGGESQGDGTMRRKKLCLECDQKFSVIVEDETSDLAVISLDTE